MQLVVNYTTAYSYTEPARRVIQLLRVTPQSFAGQAVLDWRIDVDCDAQLRESRDGYGNIIHMLYVDRPVDHLRVAVTGKVLTDDKAGVVHGLTHELPQQIFLRPTPLTQDGPAIAALSERIAASGGSPLERLHGLSGTLYDTLRFDTEATAVDTVAEQACAEGHGVCQDFAHIFIAAARRLGMPARYVSGHLFRRDGAHYQEAGHAWAEAWVDDLGWVAFDPVNGICIDDAYLRVACGLDYRDAAPVVGARSGGGGEDMTVKVQVSDASQQAQMQMQA
ncbi:transglutaminase family protein [Sphingosinicella sp. LHD-64]|uniref:transglutaminase family protein n=1 Tax=Sphingosinicella sp. LHD-64 TaxID=3072139 RepID=UPI00280D26F4|nr:transglutaminase family protein [Sphingosinicella sp. LHD-64]MDQ8756325.1 transglutaminase family protein [Sphingosinicella sp. LHD-64]